MRQTDGIDPAFFFSRFQCDFYDRFGKPVDRLVEEGLLEKRKVRVRLTRRGMRFLESVVQRMLL